MHFFKFNKKNNLEEQKLDDSLLDSSIVNISNREKIFLEERNEKRWRYKNGNKN